MGRRKAAPVRGQAAPVPESAGGLGVVAPSELLLSEPEIDRTLDSQSHQVGNNVTGSSESKEDEWNLVWPVKADQRDFVIGEVSLVPSPRDAPSGLLRSRQLQDDRGGATQLPGLTSAQDGLCKEPSLEQPSRPPLALHVHASRARGRVGGVQALTPADLWIEVFPPAGTSLPESGPPVGWGNPAVAGNDLTSGTLGQPARPSCYENASADHEASPAQSSPPAQQSTMACLDAPDGALTAVVYLVQRGLVTLTPVVPHGSSDGGRAGGAMTCMQVALTPPVIADSPEDPADVTCKMPHRQMMALVGWLRPELSPEAIANSAEPDGTDLAGSDCQHQSAGGQEERLDRRALLGKGKAFEEAPSGSSAHAEAPTQSSEKGSDEFDLAAFFAAVKPTGREPELAGDFPELLPTLRPYQRRAVHWMIQRELGSAPLDEELQTSREHATGGQSVPGRKSTPSGQSVPGGSSGRRHGEELRGGGGLQHPLWTAVASTEDASQKVFYNAYTCEILPPAPPLLPQAPPFLQPPSPSPHFPSPLFLRVLVKVG
eukprot:jgi/Mesen1/880/ME000115S00007